MKVLALSTNGVLHDGITAWIVQNFGRMQRKKVKFVDTVAFVGVDVSLLDDMKAAGIRTHILPSRKRNPVAYARSLLRLLHKNSYDVVHIHGNSATVILDAVCCLIAGVRHRIVHSHNTSANWPWLHYLLRPLVVSLATTRVACGRDAGRWLFGRADFTILPNGRPLPVFAYSPTSRTLTRQELGFSGEIIAIGHVGNFTEQKNHRFLLRAFSDARDLNPLLRLVLVGDGARRSDIEEQVAELGLGELVTLVGRTSRVSDYLCAFDAAVLPSLHEGFPTVLVEWQANGLPSLVSTAVTEDCAITDLVHFVPAGDLASWTKSIAQTEQVERGSLSEMAQVTLTNAGYDAESSARRLEHLYESFSHEVPHRDEP